MTTLEQGMPRSNLMLIRDMNPMARNFDCEVIVLQKDGEPIRTRENDLISRFLVADRTGSILLSVWGEIGIDIKIGDILRITGVENKLRRGQLVLSTPKSAFKLKRVGQDTLIYTEKPNMSEMEFPAPNNQQNNRQPRNIPQQQQQQQQQQQSRIPNNNSNTRQRGYNNAHPYNNRNRPHQNYPRNNRGGRGGGMGGRYHQDLDNPV